jgi:predicted transport protein
LNKLVQQIESLRPRIESLRKRELKETPTRTIVIDPLLEALGWDIRDPDEVELEYPTVDGKSVDYGLKINKKCVLLVEAKALNDPLADVKAITQIVNYANSGGIVWCILTNGVTWRVYRSIESCPAPDKLMYEVSVDPRDSEGMSVQQIAEQMWRFSREEIARGTLDALGEQTFTDGKVRKALDSIMLAAPRSFLNVVRDAIADRSITPQQVRESLSRVWRTLGGTIPISQNADLSVGHSSFDSGGVVHRRQASRQGPKSESDYDEAHHIEGKPIEAIELYRAIDRLCLSIGGAELNKRYLATYIGYFRGKRPFCSVHLQQGGLRVWLKLKFGRITNPPAFARDVSGVGHWGSGDCELGITKLTDFRDAEPLIKMSFDAMA